MQTVLPDFDSMPDLEHAYSRSLARMSCSNENASFIQRQFVLHGYTSGPSDLERSQLPHTAHVSSGGSCHRRSGRASIVDGRLGPAATSEPGTPCRTGGEHWTTSVKCITLSSGSRPCERSPSRRSVRPAG